MKTSFLLIISTLACLLAVSSANPVEDVNDVNAECYAACKVFFGNSDLMWSSFLTPITCYTLKFLNNLLWCYSRKLVMLWKRSARSTTILWLMESVSILRCSSNGDWAATRSATSWQLGIKSCQNILECTLKPKIMFIFFLLFLIGPFVWIISITSVRYISRGYSRFSEGGHSV